MPNRIFRSIINALPKATEDFEYFLQNLYNNLLRQTKIFGNLIGVFTDPRSCLDTAIESDSVFWARLALHLGANTNRSVYTPLHHAAFRGNVALVRLLMNESKEDITAKDWKKETPLHVAIENNKIEAAFVLIEEGQADVNMRNDSDRLPLHFAARHGNTGLIELLIEKGSNDDVHAETFRSETPLHEAAAAGHAAAVQLLLDKGASIHAHPNFPEVETPLTLALNNGHVDVTRLLLQEHKFNVEEVSKLLLVAIKLKTPDMARMLVQEFHADINIQDSEGKFLLHIAAGKSSLSLMIPFLIQECKMDVNIQDSSDKTALHYTSQGHRENTWNLIKKFKANVNILDCLGRAPLHNAALFGDIYSASTILYESKQHLNTPDRNDKTPLYLAACTGCLSMVNYLLDMEAVRSHPSAGRSLAANGNASLLRAAEKGDLPTLNRLLAYPEVVLNITANENAILRAAQDHGHRAVVERLREFPAVVNFQPAPRHIVAQLRTLANNRENAMRALDESQVGVVAAVKRHYQAKFDTMGGVDAILADFKAYLEKQYDANPARDAQNNSLPLHYDKTLPSQVPYYQNIFHTAWRYVFARPNPWIDPRANFVDEFPAGRAAKISPVDKNHFAYLWLAASDLKITPIKEFTHESMKEAFTREIALIGRAHNYDQTRFVTKRKQNAHGEMVDVREEEEFDNNRPDSPSCSMGVTQRLVQSVLGNPLTEIPEARDLNPTIFARRFNEQLLAENKNNPNGLYHRLNQLSVELLNQLKALLNVYLVNSGDKSCLSKEENARLDELKISDDEIDRFIEGSKEWFGGNRITASNQNITWLTEKYDDYVTFAKELGSNVAKHFSTKLGLMLDGLIREKSPSSVLIFSEMTKSNETSESGVDKNDKPRKKMGPLCQ